MTRTSSSKRRDAVLDLRAGLFSGYPEVLDDLPAAVRKQAASSDATKVAAAAASVEACHVRYLIWAQARARGVEPPAETKDSVLGVIAEWGRDGGWVLSSGFADGAASMYYSSGGGVIGGQAHARVRRAAKQLCSQAGASLEVIPPGEVPSPGPGEGLLRFSVLTPGGLRVTAQKEIGPDDEEKPLYPLFGAMHDLISALLSTNQRTGKGRANKKEIGYLNCLLTTLGKNPSATAHLNSGGVLPELTKLAVDSDEIEWIRSRGFKLAQLDAAVVVNKLVEVTQFGKVLKARGRFQALLVTAGGKEETVTFRVKRKTVDGVTSLEVTRSQ